jgi:GT2 family glycosyltransferase
LTQLSPSQWPIEFGGRLARLQRRNALGGGQMLNIVVGIPTVNRAPVLREMLSQLSLQTRRPDQVIVSGTNLNDTEGVEAVFPGANVVWAKAAGASCQRNAVIHAAHGADVIVFFDDDFLPHPSYLAEIERHMQASPLTAVVTGLVLADGINGPGLSVTEAKTILAKNGHGSGETKVFSAYGCNMAVRANLLRHHGLLFDEGLPLYSWQEDVDLSRQLARHGHIMQLDAAAGVHLGVKLGRGSGVKLGYSQVANPLYLYAKRRGYPFGWAVQHISRNVAKNSVRSCWSEPYVDRRGRLWGNLLALKDLVGGRIAPQRILDL